MERKTAQDFDPELLILFDAYVHGAIDRRGFLDHAAKYAVGGMTAAMMLDALNPRFAEAQQVAEGRRAPEGGDAWRSRRPQGNGHDEGLPGAAGQRERASCPGVLVVHENRGLNPHIEDIARRLALDNFVAFAPDALDAARRLPGGDEDEARALFPKLDQAKTREDFVAAAAFLKARPDCTGKVGRRRLLLRRRHRRTCWRPRVPDLAAAVPFYGNTPPTDDVPKIKAPLLHPLRGERPAHQRHVAGVRGGAEGGQRALRRCTCTRARSTASTTTPRRATTRPRRSSPGSARSSSSTSTCG